MRSFADYNPVAVAVYFFSISIAAMFTMDPVVLALSLTGGVCYFLMRNGLQNGRAHLFSLLLFGITALINPLMSHKGQTVLFVMNHNPVTLEALLYGLAAGGMIVSTLYWFRSFSQIMTSDKLLYIFAFLSPRLSLLFSMTLRYVPLFQAQWKKVRQAQTALGLYKDDNFIDSCRGGLRVFSVMITWALENGIITADSMTARGYGIGRRSHFSLFRWKKGDIALLLGSVALLGLTLWATKLRSFSYYPAVTAASLDLRILLGYAACFLLSFLPTIIHVKEVLKWRCLQSNM